MPGENSGSFASFSVERIRRAFRGKSAPFYSSCPMTYQNRPEAAKKPFFRRRTVFRRRRWARETKFATLGRGGHFHEVHFDPCFSGSDRWFCGKRARKAEPKSGECQGMRSLSLISDARVHFGVRGRGSFGPLLGVCGVRASYLHQGPDFDLCSRLRIEQR
jgi:hypothetical protein